MVPTVASEEQDMSNELARRKAEMLRHDRDDTPMHTPGPWMADFRLIGGRVVVNQANAGDRMQVALVNGGADEQDANARLIAAAPDLLEALRSLLSASADAIRYVPADGSEERDLCDAAGDAMIFARAAIARAEGRGA